MGYNVIDLIDKAINMAIKRKSIYKKIEEQKNDIPSIKVMSNVLTKEVNKTIAYYEKLKKEIGDEEFEEIDFWIYDKISFIINEYNKKNYVPEVNNVREFLKFSLDLEKDIYALIMDIQGRLVKNSDDVNTKTYKILTKIIKNKEKHIETLENILKER